MALSPFREGADCVALWSPMVVAYSAANCYEIPAMGLGAGDREALVRVCEQGVNPTELMCWLYCCCLRNPAGSASGQTNQYQQCANNVLNRANDVLGGESRYIPEQAYNMQTTPPSPLMSTSRPGFPSRNWPYRPGDYVDGFEAGEGHIRVPDVVVRNDTSAPPNHNNISRVYDFKFTETRNTREELEQMDDYREIHSSATIIDGRNGDNCDCQALDEEFRELQMMSIFELLMMLLLRGRRPGGGPMPRPVPVPGPVRGGPIIA